MSQDVRQGLEKIITVYDSGENTNVRFTHFVKKILRLKYKVGLHMYRPVSVENLIEDLNPTIDDVFFERLI